MPGAKGVGGKQEVLLMGMGFFWEPPIKCSNIGAMVTRLNILRYVQLYSLMGGLYVNYVCYLKKKNSTIKSYFSLVWRGAERVGREGQSGKREYAKALFHIYMERLSPRKLKSLGRRSCTPLEFRVCNDVSLWF